MLRSLWFPYTVGSKPVSHPDAALVMFPPEQLGEPDMLDLIFLAIGAVLFVLAALYAAACDSI